MTRENKCSFGGCDKDAVSKDSVGQWCDEHQAKDPLREVAENFVYWWERFGHGKAIITEVDRSIGRCDRIDIQLIDEDGEDMYVGTYAESGISMWAVGTVKDERGEDHFLVRVNGIVMSGLGRSIVGWAAGLE